MSQATFDNQPILAPRLGPNLDAKPHASVGIVFIALMIGGLAYMAHGLVGDISGAGGPTLATGAIMLLGMALLDRAGNVGAGATGQLVPHEAPDGNQPPSAWIRVLLILTSTGVSFAHGSNGGQKSMGLIMLVLIGAAPTAYALNGRCRTAAPRRSPATREGRGGARQELRPSRVAPADAEARR